MSIFLERHRNLIQKLTDGGVSFLVIGGYAVNFHGYVRNTGDLDIWLQPDNLNKEKILGVLSELGFGQEGIESLRKRDFTTTVVFNIWEKPFRVDFLTSVSGVDFEEAKKNEVIALIDGIKVPFIGLDQLILTKISTSRLRDQADIQELQNIMKLKKGSKR